MAITYQGAGAVAFGTSSIASAYPTGAAAGDLFVMFVETHLNSISGTITTPAGWSAGPGITGSGAGGGSRGTDTGPCCLASFYRTASGGETGSQSVSVTGNSEGWGQMLRFSPDSGSTWTVTGTTGSDSTGGTSVSILGAANPGFTAGSYFVGAFGDPTNAATFSSPAISAAGVTFGTITLISQPASSLNNHCGGFVCAGPVSSGTSTGVPTMTATAGGTTTNATGPGLILCLTESGGGGGGPTYQPYAPVIQFTPVLRASFF